MNLFCSAFVQKLSGFPHLRSADDGIVDQKQLSSLDQIGPMGRSVSDVAMLYSAICGRDPKDATTAVREYPDMKAALNKDVAGKVIGLPKEYFSDGVSEKIKTSVMNAAKELEKRDIFPDVVPETYDAQGLAKALTEQLQPGDKVFLPCAAGETPALKTLLADLEGVTVETAPVYEKNCIVPPILKPMELLDERTWAIFASGSAVRGFAAAAGQEDLSQVRALCIGAQTKAQAEQYHMHTKTAKTATLDGLVALALDCDKEEV